MNKCDKKNCFAYNEKQDNNCDCLKVACKKCSFYKTKIQQARELKGLK